MGEWAARPENAPKELNVRLRILPVVVIAILIALAVVPALATACTTIIVGKDLTADGSVLISHNEEDSGTVVMHYVVQPAGRGGDYELYSGGSAAEPNRTVAYIGTSVWDKNYIPGDFIGGVNRHQVAIYNNMTYSRWYPEDPWEVHPGGVMWTEFNILASLQAKTARQAVKIMGNLSETLGLSCDPGTSFGIADANEGWWIDIARGGQWVAQRVPDDEAQVIANCFRIGEVDFSDQEDFLWSSNLVGYAVDKGWYDPTSGEPFNFAEAYGSPESLADPYNTVRHEMVQQRLDTLDAVTPKDLMDIMSWHFEGTEYDLSDGYTTSPHTMPGVRSICRNNTQVSEVAQLRNWMPAEVGAVVWTSMRTPCSGVYVPWYMGISDVPEPYTTGTDEVSEGSAWWAFRDLDVFVNSHYKGVIPTVRATWGTFQDEMLADQAGFERQVLRVYKKDPAKARAMLTAYSGGLGMQAYETAGTLLEQLSAE